MGKEKNIYEKFKVVDIQKDHLTKFKNLEHTKLSQTAIQNRPDFLRINTHIKLLHTQAASIGSANMPSIKLTGALGMANDELKLNYKEHKDWNIGVFGQWKIIDGGEIGSKVEEVHYEINKLTEHKNALKRAIELEINLIIDEIELNRSQIETALAEVEFAQENLKIANAKLSSGGITYLELIDSQTSLLKAKSNLITSQYDFEISKAKLSKIIGINNFQQ